MLMSKYDLQRIAHVVRGLAADGVERAKSGHPGLPLGCAEIGSVLFFDIMKHSPANSKWPQRDRFVLSGGHGSMLLYSLLHLSGYNVSLDDLRAFRQVGSNTPGHPEYGDTDGVETTTGPLGQGIANAVGMAIAERMAAARFNRPGFEIVDNFTYVLAGDGDLMEGVSAEASSLAGHLKLGKLIVIYDSNKITIEGSTDITFTESVKDRYAAYGWHVQEIDGHSIADIQKAVAEAQKVKDRPSLIVARTSIAKWAPTKEGSASAHGSPLGGEEVKGLKRAIGLPEDEEFYVPEELRSLAEYMREKGKSREEEWNELFARWSKEYPELADQWNRWMAGAVPEDVDEVLGMFSPGEKVATRAASGKVLNALAAKIRNLIGGSADLAPSNNTYLEGMGDVRPDDFSGRNFNFGVREHAMGAIVNGIQLYGGFRVFGATFLVFSDYMRPAIRLAALMKLPVVFVLTHDSVYVGEDGPTHQPIEHTESLRLIPNLRVYRPADAEETAWSWVEALKRSDGPSCLVLTRQSLPVMEKADGWDFTRGGYTLYQSGEPLQLILAASGSEVSLALKAAHLLEEKGVAVRVVSIPCAEVFYAQDEGYRRSVLPDGLPIMVVEAGVTRGWYSLKPGAQITVYGIDRFGVSGPGDEVAAKLGLTADAVAQHALAFVKSN
jgi:transketolase